MEIIKPQDIEKRSFEIISKELNGRVIEADIEPIIKRVIHTTADFEYVDTLRFSENVIDHAVKVLKKGCTIITDTMMAYSGINKKILENNGCNVKCFMSDTDVAEKAIAIGSTRASVSMEKAVETEGSLIFAIGNAPTALIKLHEMVKTNKIRPELIIGVPVGFVNVVESKELIMELDIPYIVSAGRKGGSNVAAAIVNAITYVTFPRSNI